MDLPTEFVNKVDESIGELETVIGTLDRLAKKDGTVSGDEASLLSVIRNNLSAYCEFLEEVIEDGKITEDEYKKMKDYESKIMADADKQAISDDNISGEEKELLNQLKKELNEIATLEYK